MLIQFNLKYSRSSRHVFAFKGAYLDQCNIIFYGPNCLLFVGKSSAVFFMRRLRFFGVKMTDL